MQNKEALTQSHPNKSYLFKADAEDKPDEHQEQPAIENLSSIS